MINCKTSYMNCDINEYMYDADEIKEMTNTKCE